MTTAKDNQKTVMITGTSRGLGLNLAKLYAEVGYHVFAMARAPKESDGLQKLREAFPDKIDPMALDVSSEKSVQAAFDQIQKKTTKLDVLINNAGRYGNKGADRIEELDLTDIRNTFETNTLGPLLVTKMFLPLLEKGKGKRLIHITSQMGSIDDNSSGGSYGYRISKAALNMLGKNLAIDLKPKGIVSVVIHPGWVKTDMGGQNAPMSIEDSTRQMFELFENLSEKQNGQFLRYDGSTIPY